MERSESMKKKYIIELEDYVTLWGFFTDTDGEIAVVGVIKQPYTEPDLERTKKTAYDDGYSTGYQAGREDLNRVMSDMEQVRKEAFEEGKKQAKVQAELDVCHDIEKVAKGNYKAGLSDAWEAARKIADMPYGDGEKIFGVSGWHIIEKCTADEVIAEIKALEESEESKKEQSVVDEDAMRQYLDEFCHNTKRCAVCPLHTPNFTCGRGYHFMTENPVSDEEVRKAYATVLEKMRKE